MAHVNLPKTNQTGTNEWADVQDNDDAIIAEVNGSLDATNLASNAVTTAKITDANVTDAKLASPNNSVYRSLLVAQGQFTESAAATYVLSSQGSNFDQGVPPVSGGQFLNATGSPYLNFIPPLLYFDNDDYTVSSKTQKLRLRSQVLTNATAPAVTFTFGLYPITVAGGANILTITLGTVVTDSTVAIASPSSSSVTSGVNSDFTIPSDGAHVLAVAVSGAMAGNAACIVNAQLQTRHV